MPFRKYRPWKQWGKYNTRLFKYIYQSRVKRKEGLTLIPPWIHERGIKLEDPNDPDFPRRTTPLPVEISHPAYKPPPLPQEHPLFKDRPAYLMDGKEPLSESIRHALVLTKALRYDGLPKRFLSNTKNVRIIDQDKQIEKAIMQSQAWDSTLELLPKRINPEQPWWLYPRYHGIPIWRQNEVLLNNLLRLSNTLAGHFPALLTRKNFRLGCYQSLFQRHDDLILAKFAPHLTVLSSLPSAAIIDSTAEIKATADAKLENVHPIRPTVDFASENIYAEESILPLQGSLQSGTFVHTILLNQGHDYSYPWSDTQKTANAVLATFAAALAVARLQHENSELEQLPVPVVVRGIQASGNTLDFVVFQLNTLNLKGDGGVKNMVWIDGGNKFFWQPPFYDNFLSVEELDMTVFQKFMSVILDGTQRQTARRIS